MTGVTEELNFSLFFQFNLNSHTWLVPTLLDSPGTSQDLWCSVCIMGILMILYGLVITIEIC